MIFDFSTSRVLRKIASIVYNSQNLWFDVTTAEEESLQSSCPGLTLEHLPLSSLTSGISVLTSVGSLASHSTGGSPQRLETKRESKGRRGTAHRGDCFK